MADANDQLRRVRDRDYGVRGGLDRLPPPPAAGAAFRVCVTADPHGSYPDAPGVYYYVNPLRQTGAVGEGVAVETAVDATPFLAAHVGNAKVPVGTEVLVFQTGGRSVFPYYA